MPRNPKKAKRNSEQEPAAVVYGVPRTLPKTAHLNGLEENGQNPEPHEDAEVHAPVRLEPSLADILQQTLGPSDDPETGPPRADNLAVLLEQGLKSADKSLLQSVLTRNDEHLIKKTIELLPVQYVIPLIQHLGTVCAEERLRPTKAPLHWLSLVLIIRSSYLTTVPNLGDLLRNIYVYCDQRTKYMDRYIRTAATVGASVNLAKQRMSQKVGSGEKKEILAYNEPLDETESEESDEEMASDESNETDDSDEADVNQEAAGGSNHVDNEESDDDNVNNKHSRKGPSDSDSDSES